MDSLLKRTDRELILTRELKAPREKVFAAWTDPALASQWWCPSGCTLLELRDGCAPGRQMASQHARVERQRD